MRLPQISAVKPLPLPLPLADAVPVLAAVTSEDAEHQLELEWRERDYRRAQRGRRRLGVRRQPQCRSCKKFKRGAAYCEHCGYTDGVGHHGA